MNTSPDVTIKFTGIVFLRPAKCGLCFARREVDELDDLPPDERDLFQRASGFQKFVRENFGLYSPPADYKAIRAENLRRHDIIFPRVTRDR